jgi:cytochrome P450
MALPPSSNHPAVWSTYNWLRRPYPYLDELSRGLGETFRMPLLRFTLNVFSNPEHVREIFSEGPEVMEAGSVNRVLAPLLGDRSVLMTDGREHLRKRKLLLPPFHGERMQSYGQTMLAVTDDIIDAFPHGPSFSLHPFMQDATLRVIIRTVFGFEGARASEMAARMKPVLELGAWTPLLLPFMQFDLGQWSPYGRFRLAAARADELLYQEIARRRAESSRGSDILSLLLDARDEDGAPMTDGELRDELVTLLVAGHETTATGLVWALRWLLDAPELLAELLAELAKLGNTPSPADLAKNELLDATAREALRLYPVVPIVGRQLTTDRRIGGFDLSKGELVACSIYLAHRRPEAFPDPERFDPKRFLGKKLSAYEFFPFGGGIRRCIGMAFALHEMKIVLGRILMRTDLELALANRAVTGVRRSVVLMPSGGLRVRLRRRGLNPSILN